MATASQNRMSGTISKHTSINLKPGWAKFFAVLMIISGVIQCTTFIGCIIGIPLIISATSLYRGANLGDRFGREGKKQDAIDGLFSIFKAYRIIGITYLVIAIVVAVFWTIVIVVAVVMGLDLWKEFNLTETIQTFINEYLPQ